MREVDKAYAAGFFDGEGNVSTYLEKGRYRHLQARVTQNDRQPLKWLQHLFGGHIYRHANRHGGSNFWVVETKEAERFLEAIQPYLMVKGADAKEALEKYREYKESKE